MSIDELCVKKEFDQYRMNILQNPILQPIKNYGLKGLDESIYALAHRMIPGWTRKKISYYDDQIQRTDSEIASRPNEQVSDEYKQILSVKPNPATFNVLGTERRNLRLQRLAAMKDEGNFLYGSEKFRYSKNVVKDIATAPLGLLDIFGKAGESIRRNILWLATGALVVAIGYSGNHWFRQSKIYDGVAQEYIQSHEVGPNALPLKRAIPDQLVWCGINLVHTPKVEFEIDDNTITIPEKRSDPFAGRLNILAMEAILANNLSDIVVRSFQTVSDNDKSQLVVLRNSAMSSFNTADMMLIGQSDGSQTYGVEISMAGIGNTQVQNAVDILESYMDPVIVEKENKEHQQLSFWKWLSIGEIVGAGILGASAYRSARNRRWRSEYFN